MPRHTIVAGYYGFTLDVRVSVRPSVYQSVVRPSVFRSRLRELCQLQWIFTKPGMCIDIVDIWFEIDNGQIPSIFYEFSARDTPIFSFPDDNE